MTEPPTAPRPAARRIALIDALRAAALFGILQVNIQSYAWGAGDPLGFFLEQPSTADTAVYLLVATFVSLKFISLFALLFGVGFALQMRSLRRRIGTVVAARRVYRRRLWFLLAVGVLHGLLLYYGDILTAYALLGFVLVLYAGVRPARLARATRRWWIGYAVLTVLLWLLMESARRLMPWPGDPSDLPPDLLARLATYTHGSYAEALAPRRADYLSVLTASLITAGPFILGLFTLGALAGRLGWLAQPERFPRLWRAAFWLGLAALPVAAAGAWLNFRSVVDQPADPSTFGYTLMSFSCPLVLLYLALVMRWRDRPWMRHIVRWLAPAGRMPLTNYLLQSVLMGLLLSGWGLGWGDQLGHAALAALATVIVAVQLVLSRWWIARFGQGPVEAAWHWATYGRWSGASGST